jgi:hypothetical protein
MRPYIDIVNHLLEDAIPAGLGYRQDNPAYRYQDENEHGKAWLLDKQEGAMESGDPTLLRGSVTAWMGTQRRMLLPVSFLAKIPGARNEKRIPGEPQYDGLLAHIKKVGHDIDQVHILVGVNHFGEAYVIEGNTSIAVAPKFGITALPVEFRWFNGGEMATGPYSPATVAKQAVNILTGV